MMNLPSIRPMRLLKLPAACKTEIHAISEGLEIGKTNNYASAIDVYQWHALSTLLNTLFKVQHKVEIGIFLRHFDAARNKWQFNRTNTQFRMFLNHVVSMHTNDCLRRRISTVCDRLTSTTNVVDRLSNRAIGHLYQSRMYIYTRNGHDVLE